MLSFTQYLLQSKRRSNYKRWVSRQKLLRKGYSILKLKIFSNAVSLPLLSFACFWTSLNSTLLKADCYSTGNGFEKADCQNYDTATVGGLTNLICTQWSPTANGNGGLTFNCKNTQLVTIGSSNGTALTRVVCVSLQGSQGCFPAGVFVLREDSSFIPMESLQIGDSIQVSGSFRNPVYGKVLDIPHRDPSALSPFITISFYDLGQQGSITLSPRHLIFEAASAAKEFDASALQTHFAEDIQPGDWIWANGKPVEVGMIVSGMLLNGVFAPHTDSDSIVIYDKIDSAYPVGVIASCYSDINSPVAASIYFNLRRWVWPPKTLEEEPIRDAGPWEKSLLSSWLK